MEKQLLPYNQSLKLQKLGFNEDCFGYYLPNQELIIDHNFQIYEEGYGILAPLWQQAFNWFIKNRGIKY